MKEYYIIGHGERKNSDEENRECYQPASDIFKASKWDVEEGL